MSLSRKIVKSLLAEDYSTAEKVFKDKMNAIKKEILEAERQDVAINLFEDMEIGSGKLYRAEMDGMGHVTLSLTKKPNKNVYFQGDDAKEFEKALEGWERKNGDRKFDKFISDFGFDSLLESLVPVNETYETGDNVIISCRKDQFLRHLLDKGAEYPAYVEGQIQDINNENNTATVKLADGTITTVNTTSMKGYAPVQAKMIGEGAGEFNYAAAKAKKEGKKKFKLNGKTYDVTIGSDEADDVIEEYEANMEEACSGKKKRLNEAMKTTGRGRKPGDIEVHFHSKKAKESFKRDMKLSNSEIRNETDGSINISSKLYSYAKNSPHVYQIDESLLNEEVNWDEIRKLVKPELAQIQHRMDNGRSDALILYVKPIFAKLERKIPAWTRSQDVRTEAYTALLKPLEDMGAMGVKNFRERLFKHARLHGIPENKLSYGH